MNTQSHEFTVLVIGGHGFIGQYAVKHLNRLGIKTVIGTRGSGKILQANERRISLHENLSKKAWQPLIQNIDVVINAVGILRERVGESYANVHHHAVASLAGACAVDGTRLLHISALGLNNKVRSRFLSSKLQGEQALKASGADWRIIRPSLVDGEGGFGARWFRRVANWPVHFIPANAKGLIAPIDAEDLGEAIAKLALTTIHGTNHAEREFELGGGAHFTLADYLIALAKRPPLIRIKLPGLLTRMAAHLFDLLHFTPYSYGHHELLKFDNLPSKNRLHEVLGRAPTRIGLQIRKRHFDRNPGTAGLTCSNPAD